MSSNLGNTSSGDDSDDLEISYLRNIEKSDFWSLFWIPRPYIHRIDAGLYREYDLSFLQKLYVSKSYINHISTHISPYFRCVCHVPREDYVESQ